MKRRFLLSRLLRLALPLVELERLFADELESCENLTPMALETREIKDRCFLTTPIPVEKRTNGVCFVMLCLIEHSQ